MNIETLIMIKELLEEKEDTLVGEIDAARTRRYEAEDKGDEAAEAEHHYEWKRLMKNHTKVLNALQDFTEHDWK